VSGGDGTGEPLPEDPEEEQGSTQATDVSIFSLLFEFPTDVKLFLFISIFHCCGSQGPAFYLNADPNPDQT
jgi:hypothetical protein